MKNSRDPPDEAESEVNNEEIDELESNSKEIEIDGVTYYLIAM